MKQELLEALYALLNSDTVSTLYIDSIELLIKRLVPLLTSEEHSTLINSIRAKVQKEACEALQKNNNWGAIYMATGTGKSRIAVDKCLALRLHKPDAKILLSVPTEKLRDENWYQEFVKWGAESLLSSNFVRTCYASLNKIKDEEFDFVILDEGHNITENNSEFLKNNKVKALLLLTATKSSSWVKMNILKEYNIHEVYSLNLDEAVKLGLVAPYDITVITTHLDNIEKYIKAGRKDKPFFNTEKAQYGYLSTLLSKFPNKMGFINRMRFIYNLKSKTVAAKAIIDNVIPKELRTIIFCGSKEQADALCPHRYYSKPSPPKKLDRPTAAKVAKFTADILKYQEKIKDYQGDTSLNLFKSKEINQIACCEALNEGHNFDDLDIAFIVQLNSSELDLIQRIGRALRFRPGHRGKIIILCVVDSIDKTWMEKAALNFSGSNITTIELARLKMGLDKISFN